MSPQHNFLPFAQTLAQASGDLIRRYFLEGVAAEDKADGSPVTLADREAEKLMHEMIMQQHPSHGILGEEWGEHQPGADYQWVLDPIDGTKNFVAGSFLFGTLIALLHQGRPLLGVIHHPLSHQLMIGYQGQTTLNGRPVQMRPAPALNQATVLCSGHHYVAQYQNWAGYESLIAQAKLFYTWGDCHGYYLLARGGADVMLDPIMSPWDKMALIPIIEGAGGIISDWQGGDPLAGTSIIAAHPGLHGQVLQLLNP
jgi:myo-inositol-1(or 4)-monophosphatase